MLYVHVAEHHRRDLPAEVVEATKGEADPDRRILSMLAGRAFIDVRGKELTKSGPAVAEAV